MEGSGVFDLLDPVEESVYEEGLDAAVEMSPSQEKIPLESVEAPIPTRTPAAVMDGGVAGGEGGGYRRGHPVRMPQAKDDGHEPDEDDNRVTTVEDAVAEGGEGGRITGAQNVGSGVETANDVLVVEGGAVKWNNIEEVGVEGQVLRRDGGVAEAGGTERGLIGDGLGAKKDEVLEVRQHAEDGVVVGRETAARLVI